MPRMIDWFRWAFCGAPDADITAARAAEEAAMRARAIRTGLPMVAEITGVSGRSSPGA